MGIIAEFNQYIIYTKWDLVLSSKSEKIIIMTANNFIVFIFYYGEIFLFLLLFKIEKLLGLQLKKKKKNSSSGMSNPAWGWLMSLELELLFLLINFSVIKTIFIFLLLNFVIGICLISLDNNSVLVLDDIY